MTGYHISLGYNSGYSCDGTWPQLKDIAESITPDELKAEYLEYETITECDDNADTYTVDQFIEQHFKREDATIQYVEPALLDEDGKPQLMLLASGACPTCRAIKEGLRRAFCRLILHKAHKQHIEINIKVC